MDDRIPRSPSLERLLQRRPSFHRPPIRCTTSPRLTEEEASMLTSPFLTYRTTYTYANSSCYDPDLPDYWEVPNLANTTLDIVSPGLNHTRVHAAAPGLFRFIWLWICWFCSLVAYFLRKSFTAVLYEGPKSLLVLLYDIISLVYFSVASTVKSVFGYSSRKLVTSRSSYSLWESFVVAISTFFAFVSYPVRCLYSLLSFAVSSVVEASPDIETLGNFVGSSVYWSFRILLLPLSIPYHGLRFLFESARHNISKMLHETPNGLRRSKRVSISANRNVRTFDINDSPSSFNNTDDSDTASNTVRRSTRQVTPTRGKLEVHDLRSRIITADTDTEDEGFSERRPPYETEAPRKSMMHQSQRKAYSQQASSASYGSRVAHLIYPFCLPFIFLYSIIYTVTVKLFNGIYFVLDFVGKCLMSPIDDRDENAMFERDELTFDSEETDERDVHQMQGQGKTFQSVFHRAFDIVKWSAERVVGVIRSFFQGITDLLSFLINSTKAQWNKLGMRNASADESTDSIHMLNSSSNSTRITMVRVGFFGWIWNALCSLVSAIASVVLYVIFAAFDFARYVTNVVYAVTAAVAAAAMNGTVSAVKAIVGIVRQPWRLFWLLPILLLLLLLLWGRNGQENNQNDETVSTLKDGVDSDVYSSVGSDAGYAKGLTSIYDDYIASGQNAVYSMKDKIVGTTSNMFSAGWVGIKTFFQLIISFLSTIKERFATWSSDAYSSVDSDGVYAKGLTSIYDDYIASGQYAVYSMKDRIVGTVSNMFYAGLIGLKMFFQLIISFLFGIWETMAWYASYLDIRSYNILPAIASYLPDRSSIPSLPSITLPSMPSPSVSRNDLPGMPDMSFMSDYIPSKKTISASGAWIMSLFSGLSLPNITWGSNEKVVIHHHYPATPPPSPPAQTAHVEKKSEAVVVVPPVACSDPVDQEKLVKDITAKVQADMELKMKSFEQAYTKIIMDLTAKNSKLDVDYTQLEMLIRQAIYQYDADKTGLFDYALESAGASIISTRCSESFNYHSRLERIWNIPLWYSSYGPRTVIQRNSNSLYPGECWSFKNGVGYLTIDLSHAINISSISYEHIGKHQAPEGHRTSAPKTFKFWAYQSENDFSTRFLLGSYEYHLDGHPLQFFTVKEHPNYPVKIVEMEITSNYGAPYTCLYRLRVHGQIYSTP